MAEIHVPAIWTDDNLTAFPDGMTIEQVINVLDFKEEHPKAHANPELWATMAGCVRELRDTLHQIEDLSTFAYSRFRAEDDADGRT